MWEGKCVNLSCPANEVWVLDPDEWCDTCGHLLVRETAPPQKYADPDKQPDPAMRFAGD